MSVNKFIGKGNLGQDPDLRYLPDGREVVNFSMACNERWKDKQAGQIKESTEWVRVVAFGGRAKTIAEHFKKGSEIYIEGKLRTRKYEKNGVDHYATEIVMDEFDFCGGRQSGNGDQKAQQQASAYDRQTAPAYGENPPVSAYQGVAGDEFNDDIHF